MKSEGDLKQITDRAHTVSRLMEAADTDAMLSHYEKTMVDAMLNTPRNDDEGRRRYYEAVQVVRHVAICLKQILETGEMAQEQLEKIRAGKRPDAPKPFY